MFVFSGQRQNPDQDAGHRPEVSVRQHWDTTSPRGKPRLSEEEEDEEMIEPAGGRRRRVCINGGMMNETDG